MSPQAEAALIGASIAIIGILIRDGMLRLWTEKREITRSSREVFRKYADPLASASSSLLWRLNEIFSGQGRGGYLSTNTSQTKFAEYKRLSTIYRIASLLGWIRAFRRELSFLRAENDSQVSRIKEAIGDLEKALADGAHIELKRLEGLLNLWGIDNALDEQQRERLGIAIEKRLKECLHENGVMIARDLPAEEQIGLCSDLAKLLADQIGTNSPSKEIIKETRARATQNLSY